MEEQQVSKLDQAVITHLETPTVRLGNKNQRIMLYNQNKNSGIYGLNFILQ